MNDQLASVYGLKDPRNGEIFYVGMSTDPYNRYGQHLIVNKKQDHSAKDIRILDMRKDELIPELIIFEKNIPIEDVYERERYWIYHYLNLGMPLTNAQNLSIERIKKQPKQEKPMFALRQLREKYYISRKKLANLAGVSETAIINMEGKIHHANGRTIQKVLTALSKFIGRKITIDDIAS